MLTQRRAMRLARRAARSRSDGSRGRRAQWAWARLAAAGDAGDKAAAAAAWHAWLADPDDERWDLLVRWRGADEAAEAACEAAMADGGTAAGHDGQAVAAFCVRRRLTPADPVSRAVFFLLTGQVPQLRAADADGSLLALGYMSATTGDQARMRAAMAAAGHLDLVRVVVRDPRYRLATLTGEEIRYLTGQLAAQRDWAGLWRIAAALPVADAVGLMRHFGDSWQPASAHDRALFGVLASADPARLARAQVALGSQRGSGGTSWTTRIPVPGLRVAPYGHGAMPADGERLAVFNHPAEPSQQDEIIIFDLPRARMAQTEPERYPVDHLSGAEFAFASDTLLMVKSRGARADREDAIIRYEGGQVTPLGRLEAGGNEPYINGLAPLYAAPGGFVLLGQRHLAFYEASGRLIATAPRHGKTEGKLPAHATHMAADPSGLIAVAGDGGLAVLDVQDASRAHVLAAAQLPEGWPSVRFCGPGRIITISEQLHRVDQPCDVVLWQLDGRRLRRLATRRLDSSARDPVVLPALGLIAFRSTRGLRFLDSGSLANAAAPKGVSTVVYALWNSPRLDRCVLAGDGFLEIHDSAHPAAAIASRPPAQSKPQDLAVLSGCQGDIEAGSPAWPMLELLRTCLEHRFGADVGIGGTSGAAVSPDDVAL